LLARVSIALFLALILVGLGITIRFGGARDEMELELFFDLRGELPGHVFHIGERSIAAPLLLPVHGADPGHVDGPYPGTVIEVDFVPVPVESFFRPAALLAALRPGSEVVQMVREGHGRIRFGASELFWVGSSVVVRDPDGRVRSMIILGLGSDDGANRFPNWIHETRGIAIPVDRPADAPPLLARFTPKVIHLDGAIDRPDRFTERIEVQLSLEPPTQE
jgi:hypothetical protein